MVERAEDMIISAGAEIAYRVEIVIIRNDSHETGDTGSYETLIEDIGLSKTGLTGISELDIVNNDSYRTLCGNIFLAGKTCKRICIVA